MKTVGVQMDIQYCLREGMSYRAIARTLGISPRTAKKYAEHPELINQPRQRGAARPGKLDAYKDILQAYIETDQGFQATVIYERLCRQGYTGSYETVKRAVRPLKQARHKRAYLRFETEPGAQAQVDFGEFQVQQADGSVKRYYLFAMILGYSRMLYAELMERADMVRFLEAHQRAFAFLGGVPSEILYDRMRNVFIRQYAGKSEFTQSLMELAVHYNFTPRVAPAYAPWVKGKIERPMDYVRESFWRGYVFTDIACANRELAEWLWRKAERVHGTTGQRVDERFHAEQRYLGALPAALCDVSERLYREVRKDCTVAVRGNRFVVEHTLVGREVLVRVKREQLRIYDDDRLVVTYQMPETKGHLVQEPRFYEALKKDREQQARKYERTGKHKGRAIAPTISPTKPKEPIEVKPEWAIDVQERPVDIYSQLGGEVAYA